MSAAHQPAAMRCVFVAVEGVAAPAWLRRYDDGWRVGLTPIVRNRGLTYFGGAAGSSPEIADMGLEFGHLSSPGAGIELLRILGNHGKRLLVTGASAAVKMQVQGARMRVGAATAVVPKVVGNAAADPEALAKLALRILLRVEATGNTDVLAPLIGGAAIRPDPWDDAFYRNRCGSMVEEVKAFAGEGHAEHADTIKAAAEAAAVSITADRDLSGLVVSSEPSGAESMVLESRAADGRSVSIAYLTYNTYLSVNPATFRTAHLRAFLVSQVAKAVKA